MRAYVYVISFVISFFLILQSCPGKMDDALSLEPTGTAEKRMKAGRGHVCKINPIHWRRSTPMDTSPCRYRAPFVAHRGRIRLFGAYIFLSFYVILFSSCFLVSSPFIKPRSNTGLSSRLPSPVYLLSSLPKTLPKGNPNPHHRRSSGERRKPPPQQQ